MQNPLQKKYQKKLSKIGLLVSRQKQAPQALLDTERSKELQAPLLELLTRQERKPQ